MVPDSITLPIGSIAPYEPVLMPAGTLAKGPRVSPEPDSPAESIPRRRGSPLRIRAKRGLVQPGGPDRPFLGQSTLGVETSDVDAPRDRRGSRHFVHSACLKSSHQTNTHGQLLDDAEGRSGVSESVLPDQSRIGSRVPLAIADMEHVPTVIRSQQPLKPIHRRPIPDIDERGGGGGRFDFHADQATGHWRPMASCKDTRLISLVRRAISSSREEWRPR